MFKFLSLIAWTLVLSAIMGCAYMSGSGRRQSVLVESIPAGAKITDGKQVLGTTPSYVFIERGRHPELRLVSQKGEVKNLELETKYRWRASFLGNLGFLTLAPYGWLTDYILGTSWEIKKLDPIRFGSSNSDRTREAQPIHPIRIVAVAPPTSSQVDSDMGDALGGVVAARLSMQEKGFQTLPYDSTAPIFSYYGEDLPNTYAETQADHVLWSTVDLKADSYVLQGELKDVYTGRVSRRYRFEIEPSDRGLKAESDRHKFFHNYIHLLPNTVSLNLATFSASLRVNDTNYHAQDVRSSNAFEQVGSLISSVSFSHMARPRHNERGHGVVGLVPVILASYKHLRFDDFAPIKDYTFDRLLLAGGYGLEAGYSGKFGFIYIDLVPVVEYTNLRRRGPIPKGQVENTSVQFVGEVGWSYFFTQHFATKLFARTLPEDPKAWEHAFSGLSKVEADSSPVSSTFAGIALSWYIPSRLSSSSGWSVKTTPTK